MPTTRTHRLTWLLCLLWLIPGILQFLQEANYRQVRDIEGASDLRLALFFIPTWLPWVLFTPPVVALTRRCTPARFGWLRSLVAHALLCATVGALHTLLVGYVRVNWPVGPWQPPPLAEWIRSSLWSFHLQAEVLAYGVLVAIIFALDANRRAHERDQRAARLETQLATARVNALQDQLRPHFLFNTLNAIQVMMHQDVDAAETMLLRLSALLRRSLDGNLRQCIPLSEELEQLELYLGIEAVRFSDRLRTQVDVESDALEGQVPTLLLQPLVENAIRHGIAPMVSGGCVQVTARRAGEWLEIEIKDDGVGYDQAAPAGVGLSNSRQRLLELYGEHQELSLERLDSGGTRVLVRLPFRTAAAPSLPNEDPQHA